MPKSRRINPFQVLRRQSGVNRVSCYQTFDYQEALNYWRRARLYEPDAYYYIIEYNKHHYQVDKLCLPLPALPNNHAQFISDSSKQLCNNR